MYSAVIDWANSIRDWLDCLPHLPNAIYKLLFNKQKHQPHNPPIRLIDSAAPNLAGSVLQNYFRQAIDTTIKLMRQLPHDACRRSCSCRATMSPKCSNEAHVAPRTCLLCPSTPLPLIRCARSVSSEQIRRLCWRKCHKGLARVLAFRPNDP